jgi:hypothetical protein
MFIVNANYAESWGLQDGKNANFGGMHLGFCFTLQACLISSYRPENTAPWPLIKWSVNGM